MKKLFLVLFVAVCLLTGCASTSSKQNLSLQGDHGKLAAVLHTPQNRKTYPLVIIMHGFNASKDMYLLTQLSDQLNRQGLATLLFDFNGHGQSDGSFLNMTIPNELEDARRVYAQAAQLPHIQSIAMVGHSQGAIVAAMLAGELGTDKIQTLVLMSAAPELKEDTAKGELFGVSYDPKNPPDYITLSNGLKVGRAYLETTPQLPIFEVSSRYTGPVLVLHSQDDQLVPYIYGKQMHNIYQNAQLKTLHGFDHNFTQDTPKANRIVVKFLSDQLLNTQNSAL